MFKSVIIFLLSVSFTPAVISLKCPFTYEFNSTGQKAYLQSPKYPKNYSPNFSCDYNLTSPEGTRMLMNCSDFNLEYSAGCVNDHFLWSFDQDQNSLDVECGGPKFFSKISTGNKIWVHFSSNEEVLGGNDQNPYRFRCLVKVVDYKSPTTTTTTKIPSKSTTLTTTTSKIPSKSTTTTTATTKIPSKSTTLTTTTKIPSKSTTTTIPSDMKCSCGLENEESRESPWNCYLTLEKNPRPICSCTIIQNQWILTTGHCVSNFKNKNLQILHKDSSQNGDSKVDQIIIHPNYNENSQEYDIALLHLTHPIQFSLSVSPVCLAWGEISKKIENSRAISSSLISKQNLDLKILTDVECKEKFVNLKNLIKPSMICTTQESNTNICQGYGGSSIDWKSPKSGRYIAVGLISWGIDCSTNWPTVGTRLTSVSVLKWIENNTGIRSNGMCR